MPKKNVAIFGICSTQPVTEVFRTRNGKEEATKRWSHCALEMGSDRDQIYGN